MQPMEFYLSFQQSIRHMNSGLSWRTDNEEREMENPPDCPQDMNKEK